MRLGLLDDDVVVHVDAPSSAQQRPALEAVHAQVPELHRVVVALQQVAGLCISCVHGMYQVIVAV